MKLAVNDTERREHPSVPTLLTCALAINGQIFSGIVGNISVSGAFIRDLQPDIIAEMIGGNGELTMTLNKDALNFKCKIVYAAERNHEYFPAGTGVIFSVTDAQTQSAIMKLTRFLNL